MAERMHRALGIGRELRVGDEEHPRGADRDERGPRPHHPDAAGRRRIVAGPPGHDHRPLDPPRPRQLRQELARRRAALDQPRHRRARQAGGFEQIVRPVPRADVEPERARGVRHLRHMVPGQPQPHIVLGQEHRVDIGKDVGLVLAQPRDLRRGEARHRDVAGDLAGAGKRRLDLGALRLRAAIVPEDRRPQHLVVMVEADRAVHLARQPDPAQPLQPVLAGDRADRALDRAPPVLRLLLGPAGMRPRHGQALARLADQPLLAVEQHRLDRGRADINSQVHSVPPRPPQRAGSRRRSRHVGRRISSGGPPPAPPGRGPA